MVRRPGLLVLIALSGALLVPTSAAPVVPTWSDPVFEDVALQPTDGPHGQYALRNEAGELEVVLGPSNPNVEWLGLNPDATFRFGSVFSIVNTGDGRETVWLTDDTDRIEYFRGDDHTVSLEGEENQVVLDAGESVDVGLVIETGRTGQDLQEPFRVHALGDGDDGDDDGDTDDRSVTLFDDDGTDTDAEPGGEPAIHVVNASLNRSDVRPGEAVAVTAWVENEGDAAGSLEARLFVDGTYAGESRIVRVPANETRTVTFDRRFPDPGTYEVAVENESAGTVAVTPATATPTAEPPSPTATAAPPTPTDAATATASPPPTAVPQEAAGFSLLWLLVLVCLVLGVGGLAAARQRGWL